MRLAAQPKGRQHLCGREPTALEIRQRIGRFGEILLVVGEDLLEEFLIFRIGSKERGQFLDGGLFDYGTRGREREFRA